MERRTHLLGAWAPASQGGAIRVALPIEIEATQYEELKQASFRVVIFLERQTFTLVKRNYAAMTSAVSFGRAHLPTGNLGRSREVVFEIQLAVLDWILATRIFLDHTRFELSEKFGATSDELAEWDRARRDEHAAHGSYRLLYEMRDFCAHRGMPPLRVTASRHLRRPSIFEIVLVPAELLHDYRWKRHARTYLEGAADKLDFEPLAAEYMEALTRLGTRALRLLAPQIASDARAIIEAADRVAHLEGQPVVVATDDPATMQPFEPHALPVTFARQALSLVGG